MFAAVPYGNEHILYNYDFSRLRMRQAFFNTVFSASGVGVNINEDNYSEVEAALLKGNNNKRYLVLAQLTKKVD